MTVVDCPIKQDAERTIELSRDFLKSLRKLRRSLRKCKKCAAGPDCKLLREWNAQIEQAIDEVNEEWAVNDGS
jgi:hypothetical protein